MNENANYYLVLSYYALGGGSTVENVTKYDDRMSAEQAYHGALSDIAQRVKNKIAFCGGAVLLKATGAILNKQNFFRREA